MDTVQNHSIVGSIDNTVDKPAFAVEWQMQHCYCCQPWLMILLVNQLFVSSLWPELALLFPIQGSQIVQILRLTLSSHYFHYCCQDLLADIVETCNLISLISIINFLQLSWDCSVGHFRSVGLTQVLLKENVKEFYQDPVNSMQQQVVCILDMSHNNMERFHCTSEIKLYMKLFDIKFPYKHCSLCHVFETLIKRRM